MDIVPRNSAWEGLIIANRCYHLYEHIYYSFACQFLLSYIHNMITHTPPQKCHTDWQINGLVQERHNSIANALELCLSYTNQIQILSIKLSYWCFSPRLQYLQCINNGDTTTVLHEAINISSFALNPQYYMHKKIFNGPSEQALTNNVEFIFFIKSFMTVTNLLIIVLCAVLMSYFFPVMFIISLCHFPSCFLPNMMIPLFLSSSVVFFLCQVMLCEVSVTGSYPKNYRGANYTTHHQEIRKLRVQAADIFLFIKSPWYTGGDFMFLYRFVRSRRRPQILVHAITF